jgi:hypothetical protein
MATMKTFGVKLVTYCIVTFTTLLILFLPINYLSWVNYVAYVNILSFTTHLILKCFLILLNRLKFCTTLIRSSISFLLIFRQKFRWCVTAETESFVFSWIFSSIYQNVNFYFWNWSHFLVLKMLSFHWPLFFITSNEYNQKWCTKALIIRRSSL